MREQRLLKPRLSCSDSDSSSGSLKLIGRLPPLHSNSANHRQAIDSSKFGVQKSATQPNSSDNQYELTDSSENTVIKKPSLQRTDCTNTKQSCLTIVKKSGQQLTADGQKKPITLLQLFSTNHKVMINVTTTDR